VTRCQFWFLLKGGLAPYVTTDAIYSSGFGVGGIASGG
jgi:hypothetical protein